MSGQLRVSDLEVLVSWLDMLNTQDFRYELEKLRPIRGYALERAAIDYREGDKVRIDSGYAVARLNKAVPRAAGGTTGNASRAARWER